MATDDSEYILEREEDREPVENPGTEEQEYVSADITYEAEDGDEEEENSLPRPEEEEEDYELELGISEEEVERFMAEESGEELLSLLSEPSDVEVEPGEGIPWEEIREMETELPDSEVIETEELREWMIKDWESREID